jgi:hypothetical protein
VRILLGLEPDVPHGRLYIDPVLPPWCPELAIENVRVGNDRLSIHAVRTARGDAEVEVTSVHRSLEVIHGASPYLDCAPD